MSINVNDKNLGHATAYAYYKAGGGTMTEAEFTEFMADFGTASQTAVEAAQAALASKNAAQTAATTATNKASEATTAATAATNKAAEASTSASTATSAKDTAVSASQTATAKATEATTAAATATSAKTDAVAANTAAQSAKTAAQTAQTGAETAAASVSASAAQIATNTEDITQLKSELTDKAGVSELLKAFPVDTASGAIASFTDGAELPLKSLVVDIDPVQSGSGDPSPTNVRPISGWSDVNVKRTGKNMLDRSLLVDQAGWNMITIPLKPNTAYTMSTNMTFAKADELLCYFIRDGVSPGSSTLVYDGHPVTITTDESGEVKIQQRRASGTDSFQNYNFQLELGSTATTYEPYSGQSISIALGQTVYDGTLDVVSGELVIDMAMVDLGTLNFIKNATQTDKWRFAAPLADIARSTDGNIIPDMLCEVYKATTPNHTYIGTTGVSNNVTSNTLFVCDMSISEVSDLMNVINGKKIVYPLATPLTIQLTPHEVTALLGSNNVWADTGDSTVEYRADPTLYVQKKIAEAISALS